MNQTSRDSSKTDTPNRNNQFWRDCFRTALHARLLASSFPKTINEAADAMHARLLTSGPPGTPHEAAVTEAAAIADLAFREVSVSPKPPIPAKQRPVPRRAPINEIGNVATHNK